MSFFGSHAWIRGGTGSLRNLILLIAATLLALGTGEGLLRALGFGPWSPVAAPVLVVDDPGSSFYARHPTRGYTLRPGRFEISFETGYRFTTRHLTDSTRATGPADGEHREPGGSPLWIFGCSFTYGSSVNNDETLAWKLQSRLPYYDVVNHAVPGYSTVQSLRQFEEALLARPRRPALVVLVYASFHDQRNTLARARRKQMVPHNRIDGLQLPVATLAPAGTLVYAFGDVTYRAAPMARYSALMNLVDDAYNVFEKRALRSHEVSRGVIQAFADRAGQAGIPLVVAGITQDQITADLLAALRAQGIPAVDIAVDLRQPENVNRPHDSHPSAHAHTVYAVSAHSSVAGRLFRLVPRLVQRKESVYHPLGIGMVEPQGLLEYFKAFQQQRLGFGVAPLIYEKRSPLP